MEEQKRVTPLFDGKRAMQSQPTAYVCEAGRCERPTSDPAVLEKQLLETRPLFEDRSPSLLPVIEPR